MISFDGNLQAIEYLKDDLSYFPFTWGNAVRKFSDFSGDIYDREDVKVEIQDGRHFVETDQSKYDLLYQCDRQAVESLKLITAVT